MPATTLTKADIVELAKKLPHDELAGLVDELMEILDSGPPGPPMTPEELRAELDRRWEEYKSGKVKMVTWEEIKAELRQQRTAHG
jgi:putative addiction module component (TIGR02574 family)